MKNPVMTDRMGAVWCFVVIDLLTKQCFGFCVEVVCFISRAALLQEIPIFRQQP